MICKVRDTIAKHNMLSGVSSVCAGVSGGADSVALLHILKRLQSEFGFSLCVVHVNHLLRGEEAERDARFVQELCERWNIPCKKVERDVAAIAQAQKQSLETAGRAVRYAAFEEENCDVIAVAHTRSDSIETSLFHLARGTSLKGAGGIPPKNGNVIRPLIDCTREEIEAYLFENGLSFVTDSTNAEDAFSRNFVRHHVVQPLKARFPSFELSYAHFMEDAALAQLFLEERAKNLLDTAQGKEGYALSVLQSSHPAVLQCAVHMLLCEKMQKQTEREHVMLCVRAIQNGGEKIEIAPHCYFTVQKDTEKSRSRRTAILLFRKIQLQSRTRSRSRLGLCRFPVFRQRYRVRMAHIESTNAAAMRALRLTVDSGSTRKKPMAHSVFAAETQAICFLRRFVNKPKRSRSCSMK